MKQQAHWTDLVLKKMHCVAIQKHHAGLENTYFADTCMVLECSSLEMIGVKEIFDEAIRFALGHRADPAGPKLKGCVLL